MENEEKKEVKNHQSSSSMHPKKVSSPLCCKRKGEQIPVGGKDMTRRIQPLNLLPLSWGKTICVGRGSAPKIIEVMLQRPYGVRGLVSFRFSRRLRGSSKMSCVWLSTRVCILPLARVCNHVTWLLAIVASWTCLVGLMHQQSFQIEDSDHRVDVPKHVQLQEPDWSEAPWVISNLPPAPNLVKGSKSSLLRISHQQLLSQCLVEELDVELRI